MMKENLISMIVNLISKFLKIFPNRSMDDAIKVSKKLFDKAQSNIRIVGSELDHAFYENLTIVEALKEAINRDVAVEIVTGPDWDKATVQLLDLVRKGKIKLYKLDHRPLVHFTVVDGAHTWLEEYHSPVQKDRRAYAMFDTVTLGKRLDVEFLTMRDRAKAWEGESIDD